MTDETAKQILTDYLHLMRELLEAEPPLFVSTANTTAIQIKLGRAEAIFRSMSLASFDESVTYSLRNMLSVNAKLLAKLSASKAREFGLIPPIQLGEWDNNNDQNDKSGGAPIPAPLPPGLPPKVGTDAKPIPPEDYDWGNDEDDGLVTLPGYRLPILPGRGAWQGSIPIHS